MVDILGKNEYLFIIDLVVLKFNFFEIEMFFGFFDGQVLLSGGLKIVKYFYENFGFYFVIELWNLKL